MQERINNINRYIIEHYDSGMMSGLFYGKMGLSMYFFSQAKSLSDDTYKKFAERLLKEVVENGSSRSLDFEYGLSGIGWGIQTLKNKGHIHGDCTPVLKNIDHLVSKNISYNQQFIQGIVKEKIYHGLYLALRISSSPKSESLYTSILKEYLITVINLVDADLSMVFQSLQNEIDFCLTDTLPLFILLLIQTHRLNIYNQKIVRMTDQVVFYLEYNTPRFNSNKLELLATLCMLNQHVKSDRMNNFIENFAKTIKIDAIMDEMYLDGCGLQFGLSGLNIVCQKALEIPGDLIDRNNLSSLSKELDNAIDRYIRTVDVNNEVIKNGIMVSISGTLYTREITNYL